MGKLIVSMMTSVDGFIEGPNQELDWTVESADFNAYCEDMLDHTDTMLFGRVSYEMMVKYWPAAETKPKDEWERGFARRMNSLPKLVLSKSLIRGEWNNTRVLKSNVKEEVQALKQRAQKDCFVFGGAHVISSLRKMGLVDEYRVLIHPIVLGHGTPLFVDVDAPFKLQPARSQRFDSGVELLSYGPA